GQAAESSADPAGSARFAVLTTRDGCQTRSVRWWVAICVLGGACRFGFGDQDRAIDAPVASHADPAADSMRTVPPGDAGLCDATACAAGGGTCVDGACELVSSSEDPIACVPGMPCRLICEAGERPCRDGASCAGAPWCEVSCIGYRACQYGVTCGT